jgi:MOSC domain-containing protein YiiM
MPVEGVFARVLTGGDIHIGDAIEFFAPKQEG